LFHKAGAGSQVEDQRVLADMSKKDLAKHSVIPVVGVMRIEPGVQGLDAVPHRVV
jgi:hypothetical protein